jgi:tyrosine-protein kinase Etk/Wzc
MQHNIFKIDNEKGLSSVFAGSITLEKAIRRGPVEGLDLLPCGPEVPNPSELLNSKVFVEILEELSQRYDRVIIDSPPAIPVADSQILGAICDITLLVLRADRSTRSLSQRAMNSLLSIGARVLGAVVNDVSRTGGRYGYYGDYEYYNYGHLSRPGSAKRATAGTPEPVIECVATKATKKRATSERSTAEKHVSSFDTISCK